MRFANNIFLVEKFNRWLCFHQVELLIRINHFISFYHIWFSYEMHLLNFVYILFFRSLVIKNWIRICHLTVDILIHSFFVWLNICLLFTRIRTYYIRLRTKWCYTSDTIDYFFAVWDTCYYCCTSLLLFKKLSLHLYFTLWVYNLCRSFNFLLICIELLVVLCIYRFV
jgi:hypothetical protein